MVQIKRQPTVPLRGWKLWGGRAVLLGLFVVIATALWVIFEERLTGRLYWREQGAEFEVGEDNYLVGVQMRGERFNDSAARCLTWSPFLQDVDLKSSSITARASDSLCQLTEVERLDLSRTAVGDEAVRKLCRLPHLRWLNLAHTKITDKSLRELAKLPNLKWLDVSGTVITDTGLQEIVHYPALNSLTIFDCPGTNFKTVAVLQGKIPGLGLGYAFKSLTGLTDDEIRRLPGAWSLWVTAQPNGVVAIINNIEATVRITEPHDLRKLVRPGVLEKVQLRLEWDSVQRNHQDCARKLREFRQELQGIRSQLRPNVVIDFDYWGPLCDELVAVYSEFPQEHYYQTDLIQISGRSTDPPLSVASLRTFLDKVQKPLSVNLSHANPEHATVILQYPLRELSVRPDFSEVLVLDQLAGQSELESLYLADEFLTELDLTPLHALSKLQRVFLDCEQLELYGPGVIGTAHFTPPRTLGGQFRPSASPVTSTE